MLVEWQIRRELDSENTDVIWLGNVNSIKCQSTTAARDLRQVVLSACRYHFGLIHVKSELAGGHPLHCWTLATANCTFSGLQCMYSWLSSANTCNVKLYRAAMSAKSAMYRINNNGPRTEPCGTEHMTWMAWEDRLHKAQAKECSWLSWFIVLFYGFTLCLSCPRLYITYYVSDQQWAWDKQVHGMWYFSLQCFDAVC